MLKVAEQAQIFLAASVLLPEHAWLASTLNMKNAPQGRHIAFIIDRDERVQLRSGLIGHQILTLQMFFCNRFGELVQHFECLPGDLRLLTLGLAEQGER
jgi:hypothetical protein